VLKIVLTPQARADLVDIWAYIAVDNMKAADGVLTSINDRIDMLADSPEIGHRRDEISAGLRSFPESKYVIFYRPIRDSIQIIRILHGARDIETIFESM
jgi:toxin ParE1/3/4